MAESKFATTGFLAQIQAGAPIARFQVPDRMDGADLAHLRDTIDPVGETWLG